MVTSSSTLTATSNGEQAPEQVAHTLTAAMRLALNLAAGRERGNICPTRCHAGAQRKLIEALDRRGFIEWDRPEGYQIGDKTFYGAPRISEAGRAAIAKATGAA